MKDIYKRLTAFLLTLLIILSVLPLSASAYVKHGVNEAIAWAEAQVGKELDFDGVSGVQCVDLIQAYYNYLGATPVSGNGCDYAKNPLPAGWTRVKGGVPRKGDILVYSYITSSAGHVAIYGGGTTMYHGRFVEARVVKTTDKRYNWTSGYWGYIRPDFPDAPASSGLIFRLDESMNIRSGASASASYLATYSAGSMVSVDRITADNWGHIEGSNPSAWLLLDWSTYVSGSYAVKEENAVLRSSPSANAAQTAQIPAGTSLTITKIDDSVHGWGYTTYAGVSGWVCLNEGVNWAMIDISQWNAESDLNWTQLRDAGVKAVVIRVGGRYTLSKALYTDSSFYEHYKAAKAAGMHVGAYFFSYALSAAQAKEEAEFTLDILKKYNCELDMPVFIDIEDYSEDDGIDHQHANAGKTVCTTVVDTFCDTIEAAGYYPGIYCSKSFAEDLIAPASFKNRAVWIAHYSKECGYKDHYDIWQYTRTGDINGAKKDIDLNFCYTDFPTLISGGEPDDYEGHVSGAWQTVKAPTCSAEGERKTVCTDCGITLATEAVPRAEHTPSVTCIYLLDTSLKAGDTITPLQLARMHKTTDADFEQLMYMTAWQTQGGTKLTYCTTCNKVITAEYSHKTCEHSSTTPKYTAANCTTEGRQEAFCTLCGKQVVSSLLQCTSHTEGEKKSDGVTCTQTGKLVTYCAVCSKAYRTEYVAAGQHSPGEWTTVYEVSCLTDGRYTAVCSVCGETLTRTIPHPAYGDIDGDGRINAADARIALRASVSLDKLSVTQAAAGDTDNNGMINAADARNLLRLAVGLDKAADLLKTYYGTST